MSFVHVKNGGIESQDPQQAHAADAQQKLLENPVRVVPAVDVSGQVADDRVVFRQVGVDQIDGDAADIEAPGPEPDEAGSQGQGGNDGMPAFIEDGIQREMKRIEDGVGLNLPIFMIEGLAEIALPVKEPEADVSDSEVGGRFRVIGREDAQSPGGDGEGFMEAVFGAEIGDGPVAEGGGVGVSPRPFLKHVKLERIQDGPDPGFEKGILEAGPELGRGDLAHDLDRIVLEIPPGVGGQLLENRLGVLVPGPP
ncbi:MAG: hypothetical protein BWX98_00595 [Candidatus Aminicenantes bacterium ADurb.Bin147]|nr:MAG: hypothetical protein BWX98_00595 [Candidatus Aminicenantes bacterium ADurb.Bin147]